MPSLLVIGECMMELSAQGDADFKRSFAGDTYNSAVYAKRLSDDLTISYFSAVGHDAISNLMVNQWQQEGIETDLVLRSDTAHLGIYAISTDEQGERSFIYWRENSAAKQMMQLLDQQGGPASIPNFDYVYFSGISLGILADEDKARLIALVKDLRSRGAKIAFDPNYRAKMWRDLDHATQWIEAAYACSDIVFPGLDDHKDIFAQQTQAEIKSYFEQYDVTEIVIKCGSDGVYCYNETGLDTHLPFTPAPQQVDSTAAGDSFAGTYLAARMKQFSIADSVALAAKIAGLVVQHKGAIISKAVYATA